jgi:hypothetical protein
LSMRIYISALQGIVSKLIISMEMDKNQLLLELCM